MIAPTGAALFLSQRVDWIAAREDAGQCFHEIEQLVAEIEHHINRPDPPVECGPCPTIGEDQQPCAVGLLAKRGEIEVTCWKCHQTYNVEKLIQQALANCQRWLYSEREVLDIMAQIGERIPRGTWWHWRTQGKIQSRNEWGAEPKYWLEDARVLWRDSIARAR